MQMTIAAGTQDLWAALSFGKKQVRRDETATFSPFRDRGEVIEVTPLKRELSSETSSDSAFKHPQRNPSRYAVDAGPRPLTYSAPRAAGSAPEMRYAESDRGSLLDVYA